MKTVASETTANGATIEKQIVRSSAASEAFGMKYRRHFSCTVYVVTTARGAVIPCRSHAEALTTAKERA